MYGDIVAGELPISFIPFDNDVLSLELGLAFRVSPMQHHPSTASEGFCEWVLSWKTTLLPE